MSGGGRAELRDQLARILADRDHSEDVLYLGVMSGVLLTAGSLDDALRAIVAVLDDKGPAS